VISCLAALSLMPVLVLRLRPRFIYGNEPLADQALPAAAG
jgi:hypothetical protein